MAHQADSESVPSLESLAARLSLNDAESVADIAETTVSKKIDRLSFLPNELLDDIFDLAHTLDDPPTGPLSKRLFPWYIIGLYRRIKLWVDSDLVLLIKTITQEPEKGKMIKSLDLREIDHDYSYDYSPEISKEEIDHFFRKLPNLEDLWFADDEDTGLFGDSLDAIPYPLSSGVLPSLSHLQIPAIFSLEQVITCSALRNLELTGHNWEWDRLDVNPAPALSHLTHLSIGGSSADEASNIELISLCPNLTHLRLESTAERSSFSHLLSLLPTSLVSLQLLETENQYPEECDVFLTRFIRLEHLVLQLASCSPELPDYLFELDHLTSVDALIEFGSSDGWLELVSGPDRLQSLRSLNLGMYVSRIGARLVLDEEGVVREGYNVPDDNQLVGRGWSESGFTPYLFDDLSYHIEGFQLLLEKAEENGVRVTGDIPESIKFANAFLLEIRNLTMYRCHRDQSFRHIARLHELFPGYCGRLPHLDLDSLDPTKLVLVKEDLPDEGWFALSLKNSEA